jgi:hypothetical protein
MIIVKWVLSKIRKFLLYYHIIINSFGLDIVVIKHTKHRLSKNRRKGKLFRFVLSQFELFFVLNIWYKSNRNAGISFFFFWKKNKYMWFQFSYTIWHIVNILYYQIFFVLPIIKWSITRGVNGSGRVILFYYFFDPTLTQLD